MTGQMMRSAARMAASVVAFLLDVSMTISWTPRLLADLMILASLSGADLQTRSVFGCRGAYPTARRSIGHQDRRARSAAQLPRPAQLCWWPSWIAAQAWHDRKAAYRPGQSWPAALLAPLLAPLSSPRAIACWLFFAVLTGLSLLCAYGTTAMQLASRIAAQTVAATTRTIGRSSNACGPSGTRSASRRRK